MTVGNPATNLIRFSTPLLIGNLAQQLYSTVDSIVVGNYVGDSALAAIGASGPIINLLLVLFMGCLLYTSKIKRCVFPQLIMRDDLEYGPLLSVCVCLYRTSFLKEHDLRFDETVRYSEDNLFSACAGSVSYTHLSLWMS